MGPMLLAPTIKCLSGDMPGLLHYVRRTSAPQPARPVYNKFLPIGRDPCFSASIDMQEGVTSSVKYGADFTYVEVTRFSPIN